MKNSSNLWFSDETWPDTSETYLRPISEVMKRSRQRSQRWGSPSRTFCISPRPCRGLRGLYYIFARFESSRMLRDLLWFSSACDGRHVCRRLCIEEDNVNGDNYFAFFCVMTSSTEHLYLFYRPRRYYFTQVRHMKNNIESIKWGEGNFFGGGIVSWGKIRDQQIILFHNL